MAPIARQPASGHRSKALLLAACSVALLVASPCAVGADQTVAAPPAAPPAVVPVASGDLSLRQVVLAVRSGSRAIQAKRLDRDIAAASVERARAVFEPTFTASTTLAHDRQRSTPEEDLARYGVGNQVGLYERDSRDYSAGISALVSTGAKLEAKATLSEFLTNITRNLRQNDLFDHRAYVGLTLTQPLARDAGREVTTAKLRIAELDDAAAAQSSLDTESSVVAEACMAYLDLALAQQRIGIALERVRMGEQVLTEAKSRVLQGRAPESELWDVENALARYHAALSEAEQQRLERMNRLRTLLNVRGSAQAGALRAADPLPPTRTDLPTATRGIQIAIENRTDLKGKKLALERETVQLSFARNQLLPRVDLVASAGFNGLDTSRLRALDPDRMGSYPSYSIGLQVSIPMDGNQLAKADLRSALARRQDAEQSIQALEVAIANDVETSVGLIASAVRRFELTSDVAQREQRQLDLDRRRMTEGRGSLREVLISQERASGARLQMLDQQTQHAKADVLLDAAQGTLLGRFQP